MIKILSSLSTVFLLAVNAYSNVSVVKPPANGPYYELKVYHLKDSTQLARVSTFLKDGFVPALHRAGATKIGLFSEQDPKLGTNVYLFRQVASLEDLSSINKKLSQDKALTSLEAEFNKTASKDDTHYDRIETVLLSAFPLMKFVQVPALPGPKSEWVYELRSYESATEVLGLNKIQMFNQGGEIALFKRLQFNSVFYAQVIAGSHMPNLMYMTVFPNKESRDAHWKTFSDDPEWKVLVAKPEYQNNVSHIDDHFLKALPGSDI